ERHALGIGAVEAGAPKHDLATVLQDIGMNAVPQQLDRALVAVGRKHTRAAKFEELQIAVAGDPRADVELAGAVEAAVFFGERLPQQTIRADHARAVRRAAVAHGMINDQQMVADRVIAVDVAAREQPARISDGRTFLIKYAIAQFLRLP